MNKLSYAFAILLIFYLIHLEYTSQQEWKTISDSMRRSNDYFEANDYLMRCDSFVFILYVVGFADDTLPPFKL